MSQSIRRSTRTRRSRQDIQDDFDFIVSPESKKRYQQTTPEDFKKIGLRKGEGYSDDEEALNLELIRETFDLNEHFEAAIESENEDIIEELPTPPSRTVFGKRIPLNPGRWSITEHVILRKNGHGSIYGSI